MITAHSALKFDVFAEASRKRKIDEVPDLLLVIVVSSRTIGL